MCVSEFAPCKDLSHTGLIELDSTYLVAVDRRADPFDDGLATIKTHTLVMSPCPLTWPKAASAEGQPFHDEAVPLQKVPGQYRSHIRSTRLLPWTVAENWKIEAKKFVVLLFWGQMDTSRKTRLHLVATTRGSNWGVGMQHVAGSSIVRRGTRST
jgi:hypothetical protein